MGLFGKSDKEKEQEAVAAQRAAQRKMQEALRRKQATTAPKPAAAPAAKPQAVPVAAPAAAGETYTVQKGDSLSKIAKKHLGDANAWKKIYAANKAVIGDNPDKIFPGQKLTIPGGGTRNA